MEKRVLGNGHHIFLGMLPEALRVQGDDFEKLWNLHPGEHPVIRMHGKSVAIPRWQLAYARDYHFSGTTSRALPIPSTVEPLLEWARANIDDRLDGVLANWYDAALGHYIGRHRDNRRGLVVGSPIVTLSFGEERTMRFRPWRGQGFVDIPGAHGAVIVIPYATNLSWTHEVPRTKLARGRRISLTLRAFDRGPKSP